MAQGTKHLAERKRTTLRNAPPPVVQWVVSVGAGSSVLAEHLAYHITVGTRPSTEQEQTAKDFLSGARKGVATEPGTLELTRLHTYQPAVSPSWRKKNLPTKLKIVA